MKSNDVTYEEAVSKTCRENDSKQTVYWPLVLAKVSVKEIKLANSGH